MKVWALRVLASSAAITLISVLPRVARADAAPPLSARTSLQVSAYVSQPAHVAAVSAAATKAFSTFWNCPVSNAGADVRVVTFQTLGPVSFSSDLVLASGIIAERLPVSGCGTTHLQNVLTIVSGGKLAIVPSVAGTTMADPLLIHDTLPIVYSAAAIRFGPCKHIKFVDTAFDGFEGPSNPAAKLQDHQGRPWREVWSLNGCGMPLSLAVHYVPNATGTAISAGAR